MAASQVGNPSDAVVHQTSRGADRLTKGVDDRKRRRGEPASGPRIHHLIHEPPNKPHGIVWIYRAW